jgi:hypothetical protein
MAKLSHSKTILSAKERSDSYMTGMLGLYLTAVELIKRGFIVSPTSRSAWGADLLVTDKHCKKAWSVQVKTNGSNANSWLLNPHWKQLASRSHVYVFVSAPKTLDAKPSFYVVPSAVVSRAGKTFVRTTGSVWHGFQSPKKYKDNWKLFGDPQSQ